MNSTRCCHQQQLDPHSVIFSISQWPCIKQDTLAFFCFGTTLDLNPTREEGAWLYLVIYLFSGLECFMPFDRAPY